MGRLVVIEGLDGAGKRTLTEGLSTAFAACGASVSCVAFPRYGHGVHADVVRDALHGRFGDLAESVYGMAVLFALDRLDARQTIERELGTHDVVLADRYIASNAAYGAARLHQDAHGDFVAWVRALEVDRFGLPAPYAHLLLRVPVALAASRAARRANEQPERVRDDFESDDGLQTRCARVYDQLAAADWLAPWWVVDGATTPDCPQLAADLLG